MTDQKVVEPILGQAKNGQLELEHGLQFVVSGYCKWVMATSTFLVKIAFEGWIFFQCLEAALGSAVEL